MEAAEPGAAAADAGAPAAAAEPAAALGEPAALTDARLFVDSKCAPTDDAPAFLDLGAATRIGCVDQNSKLFARSCACNETTPSAEPPLATAVAAVLPATLD